MREYYSVRTGKNPNAIRFNIQTLRRLFLDLYIDFVDEGYFQEFFGYECVDAHPDIGFVPGKFGRRIEAHIYRLLKKELWPINIKVPKYSEDDLFDVIEFLFDYISKPIDEGSNYHSYMDCGYHYNKFDRGEGRREFRKAINELLSNYDEGFELSFDGRIFHKISDGLERLIKAELPSNSSNKLQNKIKIAINKFLSFRSNLDERRNAVRELADILELLRPEAKKIISNNDESDLFNLANNFGIRHYNENQKLNYDRAIWLSWMFYYYLATIHACLRLIKRNSMNLQDRKLRKK